MDKIRSKIKLRFLCRRVDRGVEHNIVHAPIPRVNVCTYGGYLAVGRHTASNKYDIQQS